MPSDTRRHRYRRPERHTNAPVDASAPSPVHRLDVPRRPPLEQYEPSGVPGSTRPSSPYPPLDGQRSADVSPAPQAPSGPHQRAVPPHHADRENSDTRRRMSEHGKQPRPAVEAGAGAATERGKVPGLALHLEQRRNPRLLGGLAYAIPFLPAIVLLIRQRDNRFVRAHAAQSLVFFASLGLGQMVLFGVLLLAGGLMTGLSIAIALAVALFVAWMALAAVGFFTWTRLIGAALAGRVAVVPGVTPLAQFLLRKLDGIAAGWRQRKNH
jgi:uncharacterized membrane protein